MPEELPVMTDPATTRPVGNTGFKYWKLAIFKGVNGYMMAMAMAFLAFTDGEDWKTPGMRYVRLALFCFGAGHKFLDGFFDQTFSLLKSLKEQFASISDEDQGLRKPLTYTDHTKQGKIMKTIQTLIACSFAVLLTIGCANLGGKGDRTAGIVKIAAFNGTQIALIEHPEWQPAFITARDDLALLEKQDTIDFADVLIIVQRLPIKELRSQEGRIVIGNGMMLLEEFGASTDISTVKIRPVVTALRVGISRGLP